MDDLFLEHADVDMKLSPALYEKVSRLEGYEEAEEIMIHYTVTEACPFNCRGCINPLTAGIGGLERSALAGPAKTGENLDRDIRGIADLIRKSGKARAVIVFYGGEPMLRLDKMNRFYEKLVQSAEIPATIRYVVITSGHYLEKAIRDYPGLTSSFWLTTVSVDGTDAQHEAMRCGTSLDTIRRQVASLNRIRTGDVLIWSTMRPGMSFLDCFHSYMSFRDRGHAEHFFWHWDEAEGDISDLRAYLESYRKDLHTVMQACVDHLGRGDLLSMVHVNELILYLLTGKHRGSTACAVEKMANFDIIGDGKVHGCADLPEAMSIGRINESGQIVFDPDAKERLEKLVMYKGDLGCSDCGIEPYCGGRCPVQIHIGGIGRARQYCYMMREHVRTVKQYVEPISDRMLAEGISLADLYRSARYTKFTDVIP